MPANETLDKIRKAETDAAALKEAAADAAQTLLADAKTEAEKKIADASADAVREKKTALDAIADQAQKIADEERKDAVFEAERLKNRAVRYREEAVRYICSEIEKKCQS